MGDREPPDSGPSINRGNRAHQAWETRGRILARVAQNGRPGHFLRLSSDHAAEGYPVGRAARDLGVTPRHLDRLSLRAFGLPPKVVIDLVRVEKVSRALRETDESVRSLAAAHGFSSPGALSRIFQRFVKIRPGAYRHAARSKKQVRF